MSRGPHDARPLPSGWSEKLEDDYRRLRFGSLRDFCAVKPTISLRTIQRAKLVGRMPTSSLTTLAEKLKLKTADELVARWSAPTDSLAAIVLDGPTSQECEERYQAFVAAGLYEQATVVARETYAAAANAGDVRLMSKWADLTGGSCRMSGRLEDASAAYANAWSLVQTILAESPDDVDALYQAGKIRFGRIMVDDYLNRTCYPNAYAQHTQLLGEVNRLADLVVDEGVRARIAVRRTNVRRQQAEMLRYMGRYGEARTLIEQVLSEYPPSAYEELCYAKLSLADSLRLTGELEGARAIYLELEAIARGRQTKGLLGSILWRVVGLHQLLGEHSKGQRRIDEAVALGDKHVDRYRLLVVYSLLASATGRQRDPEAAMGRLQRAEAFGPLSSDHMLAMYAHVALCRAELLRAKFSPTARRWFQRAFESYVRMGCRWGIARSWIGLRVTGSNVRRPDSLDSLEGIDAQVLNGYEDKDHVDVGELSMNLP